MVKKNVIKLVGMIVRVVVRPYPNPNGKKVVQHIKIQLIRLKRQMLMVKFNMNESMIL